MLNNLQINKLLAAIKQSKEYLSLMNKTQVLNERKLETTSTRGSHTNEVADISRRTIEELQDEGVKTNSEGEPLKAKLAELIGMAHDLGHTPYGHDGEAKINECLGNIEASQEYLNKRRENFGDDYENEQDIKFQKEKEKDPTKKRYMQFEHNEHSAEIFLKICEEQGIDKSEVSEVVTGILAHSTSRVKEVPKGVEQQAVRLADKIAYINRDIDDMLNEEILSMGDIPEDLRGFASENPEKRISLCVRDAVDEYQRDGIISGGSKEIGIIKKAKKQIFNEEKNIVKQSGRENEIINKLLETMTEENRNKLLKKWQTKGNKKAIDDVIKISSQKDKIEILGEYEPELIEGIIENQKNIDEIREEIKAKYKTMEKCYRLKDATDGAIFQKDENGIARIGNDVKKTQNEIGSLFNYYNEHYSEIPVTILREYDGYTKEEQVAFYIAGLDNNTIQKVYETAIQEEQKTDQEQTEVGQYNYKRDEMKEEKTLNESQETILSSSFIESAGNIASTRKVRNIKEVQNEIKSGVREMDNPEKVLEGSFQEK